MAQFRTKKSGVSLVEVLVSISIISILLGLLLTAIQKVRIAALRLQCANHLRQCSLALHQYHDSNLAFPAATLSTRNRFPMSWQCQLLPYLEQEAIYQQAIRDFDSRVRFGLHPGLSTIVKSYACPLDPRASQTALYFRRRVAVTSYLSVTGADLHTLSGIMYQDSHTCISDISDGCSNTIMVGERPASSDNRFGWWYAGVGQRGTGSLDSHLGVRERNHGFRTVTIGGCPNGPYSFQQGTLRGRCAVFHFWSLHPGGSHFAFADGSVKFLRYSADPIMPALATRAGGEVVAVLE